MKTLKKILIPLVLALGCNPIWDDNIQILDSRLYPYWDSFMVQASIHGYIIPDKNIMLHLEPLDNLRGLCKYNKNYIHIYIDKDYFEHETQEGFSLRVEFTLFHELGHGFWGRDHNCDYGIRHLRVDNLVWEDRVPDNIMYNCPDDRRGCYASEYWVSDPEMRLKYIGELFNY